MREGRSRARDARTASDLRQSPSHGSHLLSAPLPQVRTHCNCRGGVGRKLGELAVVLDGMRTDDALDLLVVLGLFLVGRRFGGPSLSAALVFGWMAMGFAGLTIAFWIVLLWYSASCQTRKTSSASKII